MRLSIFILKIFRIEQRTMYFSVYLINVGNGTFLIRTMAFSKYCWNSDHGGHLHLPHPRRQGRVPDLLLGHVTAQLHAPELDHPHKCCQGVTSSQRGGHCDIPALENNIRLLQTFIWWVKLPQNMGKIQLMSWRHQRYNIEVGSRRVEQMPSERWWIH